MRMLSWNSLLGTKRTVKRDALIKLLLGRVFVVVVKLNLVNLNLCRVVSTRTVEVVAYPGSIKRPDLVSRSSLLHMFVLRILVVAQWYILLSTTGIIPTIIRRSMKEQYRSTRRLGIILDI